MPFSVSVLRIHPCRVSLLHERIPVLRRIAEEKKDGDERENGGIDGKQSDAHDLLVVLAEVEVLFVVEEKVLRWDGED